jgi:endonuclease III
LKHEQRYVKAFEALLRKLTQQHKAEPSPQLDPVTQLIVAFLEWNATRTGAEQAHQNLMAELVDNNDLRVSLPQELLALIGPEYPLGIERVTRLREVLHEIYYREHCVSLQVLEGKPKKQVRTYIESLPGITPYVAAQVMLMGFGVHAMPVDDRLAQLLVDAKAVDAEATVSEVSRFIERRVKAGEVVAAHHALRHWADSHPLPVQDNVEPEKPEPQNPSRPAARPKGKTKSSRKK